MKQKLPLKGEYSGAILSAEEFPVAENPDFTCAILEKEESFYPGIPAPEHRVAQVGFQFHNNIFCITNIQGPGPHREFRKKGLSIEEVFNGFREKTGLKPLNTIICLLSTFGKKEGIKKIISIAKGNQHFNPNTTLFACGFREEDGQMILRPPETEKKNILKRTTGPSPEKNNAFNKIYEIYRQMLEKKIPEVNCY